MQVTSRLVPLLIVVLIVGIGGCSTSGDSDRGGSPATSVTSPTGGEGASEGSGTTMEPSDEDFAQLEALLVQEVEGYELQPNDVGDTGPSDLEKAQRDEGTDEGAEQLVETGFDLGYQKLYVNEDGDEIIIFVYRFASDEGAAAKCKADVERAEEQAPVVEPVEVPGVPTLYAYSGVDGGYEATAVGFARGPYCVRIIGIGEDRPDVETPAVQVAQQQYELLG